MTNDQRLRLTDPFLRTFLHVLVNVLLVSLINFTIWFALTFFVYIETKSVFATGMIAGIFLLTTLITGVPFGSLVDNHPKKKVMQGSAAVSWVFYAASLTLYLATPREVFTDPSSARLWAMVVLAMAGVMAGNLRSIALPTLVTVLVPAEKRDRANGLVGTTSGVAFLVTSVISGLMVGWNGMLGVLVLALVVVGLALFHLYVLQVPAEMSVAADAGGSGRTDLAGTFRLVKGIPGLMALVVFAAMNNFLGGVFMALMDAYGLSMVTVQEWGLIWGGLSSILILSGLLVARTGLGAQPVRLILFVNLAMWLTTAIFPLRNSIWWLAAGMIVYMALIPYVEAAEQTVLQKVVPYERQGRVFGFAQSVEQSASPLTAFLISPLAQFAFIPFMTDGRGADWIGSWFGTGPSRGIALAFVIAALLGLALTAYALASRYFRQLSAAYADGPGTDADPDGLVAVPHSAL